MVDVPPGKAVLIGDSDFDMQAAVNAGTRSIAYANERGKEVSLAEAGADAAVRSMHELAVVFAAVA